jgi:hypothetical protein
MFFMGIKLLSNPCSVLPDRSSKKVKTKIKSRIKTKIRFLNTIQVKPCQKSFDFYLE